MEWVGWVERQQRARGKSREERAERKEAPGETEEAHEMMWVFEMVSQQLQVSTLQLQMLSGCFRLLPVCDCRNAATAEVPAASTVSTAGR